MRGLDPVRLCCGQRHYGPQCPDGKVRCCLCFERFDVDDLNVVSEDFEGQHEDVCRGCAEKERNPATPERGDEPVSYDATKLPVIRVAFRLASGEVIERIWNMQEATEDPLCARLKEGVPEWLDNAKKAWDHPQDPITFSGDVRPGHEADARAFATTTEGRTNG